VSDFVSPVFEVLDLSLARRKVRYVSEGLLEEVGGLDERCSLLLEEVVEALLPRDERQCFSIPS
jgi:hypothetical protein